MAQTEFAKDREEMGKIREQLMELRKKQHEIRIRIIQGKQKIHKEKIENNKKIAELQKKLGLPVTQPKKLPKKEKKHPHIKNDAFWFSLLLSPNASQNSSKTKFK